MNDLLFIIFCRLVRPGSLCVFVLEESIDLKELSDLLAPQSIEGSIDRDAVEPRVKT